MVLDLPMHSDLRVAYVPNVPLSTGFGGLELQLLRSMDTMRDRGCTVVPLDPWARQLDVDVVHIFGGFYHQAELVLRLKAMGPAVVITPMFVRTRPRWTYPLDGAVNALPMVTTLHGIRTTMLRTADALCALSPAEAEDLSTVFGCSRDRINVIPNGVDDIFFAATPDAARIRLGTEPYILCVASIEPNKNQLAILEAAHSLSMRVVFVGYCKHSSRPSIQNYARDFRKAIAANPFATWIEGLDHHDPLLPSLYAGAAVHVLASHAEAVGIASLEAAAAGTPLVMSNLATLRSTFGNYVDYCTPTSPASIARAIMAARERHAGNDRPPFLRPWSAIGERLLDVYRSVVL
jgi:glycosyltransferase involved in cell wall biosynthesis